MIWKIMMLREKVIHSLNLTMLEVRRTFLYSQKEHHVYICINNISKEENSYLNPNLKYEIFKLLGV
jgi:hypothetical protein